MKGKAAGDLNAESFAQVSSGLGTFHETMERAHQHGSQPNFQYMKKHLFAKLTIDANAIEKDIVTNGATCQCSGTVRGNFATCLNWP